MVVDSFYDLTFKVVKLKVKILLNPIIITFY